MAQIGKDPELVEEAAIKTIKKTFPSLTKKEFWLVTCLVTHWQKGESVNFLQHSPTAYFNEVLISVNKLMIVFRI